MCLSNGSKVQAWEMESTKTPLLFNLETPKSNLTKTMSTYVCDPIREIQNMFNLSPYFEKMVETNRVNDVRFMLLPITSLPNSTNELTSWDPRRSFTRKRKL